MNDKDKEVFEKHINVVCNKKNDYERFYAIWQAACEYKQKEIDELNKSVEFFASENTHYFESLIKVEAENAKLRECVESFVDKYFDLPLELRLQKGIKEGKESLRARQVLKELEE